MCCNNRYYNKCNNDYMRSYGFNMSGTIKMYPLYGGGNNYAGRCYCPCIRNMFCSLFNSYNRCGNPWGVEPYNTMSSRYAVTGNGYGSASSGNYDDRKDSCDCFC